MSKEPGRGAARKAATWLLEAVGVLVFAAAVALVGTWLSLGRAGMKIIVAAVIFGLIVLISLPEFLRPWPKGRHKKSPP